MKTTAGQASWPQEAFTVAEQIAAADLNNLYRVSCFFSDPARYLAFCAMYAVMRIVDDRVDGIIGRRNVSAAELESERKVLSARQRAATAALVGEQPDSIDIEESDHSQYADVLSAFALAAAEFPVPRHLWRDFFVAMHRDLEQRRFDTYKEFLAYAEGATIAPTTIFLFLIASETAEVGGPHQVPEDFDLQGAGRDLGIFAYLAHIVRDLAQDLQAGDRGLLYVTTEDLTAHGLIEESLRSDAESGHAGPEVRALVKTLVERAREAMDSGRARMAVLDGRLGPDRSFILELVVRIYEAVLDKVESCSFEVMAGSHRLTDFEKEQIVAKVAHSRGFTP
jgi:phytoene synthase